MNKQRRLQKPKISDGAYVIYWHWEKTKILPRKRIRYKFKYGVETQTWCHVWYVYDAKNMQDKLMQH